MNAVLTLPLDLAAMILNEVLAGPNKGWQGYDEKHSWTIGHGRDEVTGAEFLQVSVEPILAVAKD